MRGWVGIQAGSMALQERNATQRLFPSTCATLVRASLSSLPVTALYNSTEPILSAQLFLSWLQFFKPTLCLLASASFPDWTRGESQVNRPQSLIRIPTLTSKATWTWLYLCVVCFAETEKQAIQIIHVNGKGNTVPSFLMIGIYTGESTNGRRVPIQPG